MSLPVQEMVEALNMQNPECILCGNCADTGKKGVIRLAWKWNRRQGLASGRFCAVHP